MELDKGALGAFFKIQVKGQENDLIHCPINAYILGWRSTSNDLNT